MALFGCFNWKLGDKPGTPGLNTDGYEVHPLQVLQTELSLPQRMLPFSKLVCDGSHTHCPPCTFDSTAWECGGLHSLLRDVIGFGWFYGRDVTVCSKGMVQSWWGTWILGMSCLHPLLLMGWPPGREQASTGPCSSLSSVPFPTPLLQYSTAASRPPDGPSDERALRESDGTDPHVESQVLSVLWHPAPADVAD